MNYKTSEIAKISCVSTRTLRYYDEINLLKPSRIDNNGYRVYTDKEIDKLQMILFYRELGLPLEEIKLLLSSENFNKQKALEHHLKILLDKKIALEKMISNVTLTINSQKEGITMSNKEKFNGLELVAENESKYGNELKEKYGEEPVKASFEKIKNSNFEDVTKATVLLNQSLVCALKTKDPSSNEAQIACDNHKNLLLMTWADGMYSKESHLALVESFKNDERFTNYYENIAKGLMNFFYDAIKIYCK